MDEGKVIPKDRIGMVFSKPAAVSEQLTTVSEQPTTDILEDVLTKAVEMGTRMPSVSLYSPIVASMMAYLKLTTPNFCKSEVGTREIELVFKRKYPDIWAAAERRIRSGDVCKRRKATILRR